MAALSPASNDRLVLLGIGISTIAVIGLMRRMLVLYRDAAAIPASENKPQYITQDVEDSLKLSTLDKLLDSPNYCIQETTAIIVCERALHDSSTIDALMWYITRPEHDEREKGIRALTMMMNSSTVSMINKPSTYAALVKSLEYSVADYRHNKYDPEWDNWPLRDVVEQGCLLVLCQLADKFGVEGLLKARFIERWLVKEPWGEDEYDRQKNFAESMGKENRLNEILIPIFRDRGGQIQLGKAKLIPQEVVSELGKDVKMTNGESTSGEGFDGMFVESRRRRDHQTFADDNLRRRHREAVVIRDGVDTRPLERGDIIQRER